ncbi:MAG: HTTM domain-containing protein, partial [Cytophagaceae bacterium]
RETFIDPGYAFTFIGFEWLHPEPGGIMYIVYGVMAGLGLLIMTGWQYRISMILFTFLWWSSYLMQKTNYNNHYYLLLLLSGIMIFLPAEKKYSMDAARNPAIKSDQCHYWCKLILIVQISIVYFFAGIGKISVDWLQGKPLEILFASRKDLFLIGDLLQQTWFRYFIAYGGILFDLFIIPALLWKKTRVPALLCCLFFHLFNSCVFGIGVFPYLMIGTSILFIPARKLEQFFFRTKSAGNFSSENTNSLFRKRITVTALLLYISIQLLLPLRHLLYKGNVHWTEQGHRMSWHMMLRVKTGSVFFRIDDPERGVSEMVYPFHLLNPEQYNAMACRPDMIWQFSRHLHKLYLKKGFKNPEIYAFSSVSLNGRVPAPLISSKVDLLKQDWDSYTSSPWILSEPE